MIHFKNLISVQYLFTIEAVLTRTDKLFLLLGAIAVVLAVLMKIASATAQNPIDKKYREKPYRLLLTVGLWEIIWFGCRYENVRFFGTHFVALLGLLIALVWFVMIVVKMIRNYRGEKSAWEKEQVKLRYLPR